ncbi:hypothetical protein G9A89_014249 [Geosiphon pyriformis]|nr:hypothetical protein G9A89_014249 [Geosiphon pyriformis]
MPKRLIFHPTGAREQVNLGRDYLFTFQQPDHHSAFYWFERAAQQNESIGHYWMGRVHQCGYGTMKDPHQALKWYLHVWQKGPSVSQFFVRQLLKDFFQLNEIINQC